ncbi:hypothetical protein EGW08_022817, partial [Elysia chlorotica]
LVPSNNYEYEGEEEEDEPEYAVVHKRRGDSTYRPQTNAENTLGARASHVGSDDYSTSGAMPPEPPRLFNAYEDEEEEETYSVTSPTDEKKEHRYSRVTARESLASMSARNALNPYELVNDMPENMYATVEGGSGDGIVLRHMDSDDNNSNRNSQNSDTYAEIAVSGSGGFRSSTISNNNNSSNINMGSTNNSSNNSNANNASMNNASGASSGAPDPPSLDSLHLMTKSQTSSEDDRLSDRHLASPEDSGFDATGFPRLPAWGSRTFMQGDEDSGGSIAEDGYSTLKRVVDAGARGAERESLVPPDQLGQMTVRDEESGEVTQLSQGYSRVKDHIRQADLEKEMENDPNYESVDEARAKLRLLYKTEKRIGEENDDAGNSSNRNHVTVVEVLHSVKTSTVSSSSKMQRASSNMHTPPSPPPHSNVKTKNASTEDKEMLKKRSDGKPRRRPNHDYEELDLSPPTSPTAAPG